jgi:hypothetical protein
MRGPVLAIVTGFQIVVPWKVTAWDHWNHEKRHGKHRGNDDEFDDRDYHGRYAAARFRGDNPLVNYDHRPPAGLPPACLGWMGR